MAFGGMSKASKGVNLSEDIFAGFNWTLRGGTSSQADYIECGKGRDTGGV
jgi:callose synthase